MLTLRRFELPFNYADLQFLSEVDHLPQLEAPYPITNGGQQRYARQWQLSSSIPLHIFYIKQFVSPEHM